MNETNGRFKNRQLHIEDYRHMVSAEQKEYAKVFAHQRISKQRHHHRFLDGQSTCSAYREATEGFINSYPKKAFPGDNACIESFHVIIKREWLNRFKILDYNNAYRLVFEYIEAFL